MDNNVATKNHSRGANPIDIHVGNRIKLRRRVLDLTQNEMAEMLGITFQQIQKYEKGINRVSASRLWDFACVLGVDINFFYQDMSDEIFKLNPLCLTTNNKISKTSFEYSNEGMELLRSYYQISKRPEAKHIFALLKSLASSNNDICSVE